MASANNLGTAYIKIAPSMAGIQSSITKGFTTYGSEAGQSFNTGFIAKSSVIASTIASVTTKALSSITSHIDDAIARVDTLRVFPKIMKNLGFEAEESSSAVQLLSDRIEGLPTTLDEIVTYTQRLASTMGNLNKGTKNATKLAIAFNDAALAGGKGQAEANRAFEQFVQVISRGRPSMQDWKIMMEVMPGQLKQMARYMYDNNDSLRAFAKNAKKTADELDGMDLYEWISENKNEKARERLNELTTAIIELDENGGAGIVSFKEQVGDATHTIGTAMRLIGVRITKALATVIEAFGADDIYNTIDKFTTSFKGVGNWIAGNIVPIIKNQVIPIIKNMLMAAKSVVEFIAQNKWVQNTLRALLDTILAFKVLKTAKSILTSLIGPIVSLVSNIGTATTAFKAAHAAGLTFSTSMGAASAATKGATSSITGFASKLTASIGSVSGFGSALTTLGLVGGIIGMLAVDAQALYYINVTEGNKARKALRDYERQTYTANRATEQYNKSLSVQNDVLSELSVITKALEDEEYQALSAKQNAKKLEEEYNELKKDENATTEELRMKEIELKKARELANDTQDKLNASKKKQLELSQEYKGAALGEITTLNRVIATAGMQTKSYYQVAQQLDDLRKKTITYRDENGNLVQATKQDTTDMVNFISEEVGKINPVVKRAFDDARKNNKSFVQALKDAGVVGADGFASAMAGGVKSKIWMITDATKLAGDSLIEKLKSYVSESKKIGQNMTGGIATGITSGIGGVLSSIKNVVERALATAKKAAQIHSPSRITESYGKFIDLGFVEGIEEYASDMQNAAAKAVDSALNEFDRSASVNLSSLGSNAPTYGQLGASESDNARIVQNNVFNQVDSELDVKEASRLLGWQVATTI